MRAVCKAKKVPPQRIESGPKIQFKRMNSPYYVAQRRMHRPVPGNAAHVTECCRLDRHPPVAFTALLIARVPAVPFAVIDDLQPRRLKRRLQPVSHLIRNRHFSAPASSASRRKQ